MLSSNSSGELALLPSRKFATFFRSENEAGQTFWRAHFSDVVLSDRILSCEIQRSAGQLQNEKFSIITSLFFPCSICSTRERDSEVVRYQYKCASISADDVHVIWSSTFWELCGWVNSFSNRSGRTKFEENITFLLRTPSTSIVGFHPRHMCHQELFFRWKSSCNLNSEESKAFVFCFFLKQVQFTITSRHDLDVKNVLFLTTRLKFVFGVDQSQKKYNFRRNTIRSDTRSSSFFK